MNMNAFYKFTASSFYITSLQKEQYGVKHMVESTKYKYEQRNGDFLQAKITSNLVS